ncbi:hypothetical protein C6T53_05005 [Burkholderia multivorans]|nr:hypothetical protein C6T53_05005 [Burkholderia multivorans]
MGEFDTEYGCVFFVERDGGIYRPHFDNTAVHGRCARGVFQRDRFRHVDDHGDGNELRKR